MCDLNFCVEFALLSNCMSSCFKFSLLLCSLPIPHNNGLCRLYSYLFCGRLVLSLCYLYLFTYTGAQHNYRMMSVSLNSNIMNAISGAGTAYHSRSLDFSTVLSFFL
jgi:hypothetical protein